MGAPPTKIVPFNSFNTGLGLIDLAAVADDSVWLLLNNGRGGFSRSPIQLTLTATLLSAVAVTDFSGDGIPDMAVTDYLNGRVFSILFPEQQVRSFSVGGHPLDITLARLSGNTVPELVVANYTSRSLSILQHSGNGRFREINGLTISSKPIQVVSGYFTPDSNIDIALAGIDPYRYAMFPGLGNGHFDTDAALVYSVPDLEEGTAFVPLDITAADLNNDGLTDLLLTSRATDSYGHLLILPNINGSFPSIYWDRTGANPQELEVADYNGDGNVDILVTSRDDNTLSYHKNVSSETGNPISFADREVIPLIGQGPIGLAPFDPFAVAGIELHIGSYVTQTDSMGRFELHDVAPGSYQITAFFGGTVIPLSGNTQIPVGSTNIEGLHIGASIQPGNFPSDYFTALWGLNNTGQNNGVADVDIDAPEAWSITEGSSEVVVGIVDSGIDYEHWDLVDNVWHNPGEIAGNAIDDDQNAVIDDVVGYDACNDDGDPSPGSESEVHGTHVAGTIAASAEYNGVVGVAPGVKIMPLRFINSDGSGSTADVIAALGYAYIMVSRGVNIRVLNNSWGAEAECIEPMQEMIQLLNSKGIVFVAAAGNSSSDNDAVPSFPANCPNTNVISVAATTARGNLADFSNYGLTKVDVAAPGNEIVSTIPGDQYDVLSGTSMASPHVAGIAALVLSEARDLSARQVRDVIKSSVKHLSTLDGLISAPGIVSAYRSVKLAESLTGEPYPGIDTDGGRVEDDAEGEDGTDRLDRGSLVEHLSSPVLALWNGFLGMTNVLELVNKGKEDSPIRLTLYTIDGSVGSRVELTLAAGTQHDIVLNDVPGFAADSYGLVKIAYEGEIDGRVFFYRPGVTSDTYDFAFGLPLGVPLYGASAVAFNTFQPSTDSADSGNLVANWLSIVNLTDSAKSFTIEKHNQAGNLLSSEVVTVGALGRIDVDGGHISPGQNQVGLNTITLHDTDSPYSAQLMRYGYARNGSLDFPFPLLARPANGRPVHVPISSMARGQNWLELVNASANPSTATIAFYNNQSTEIGRANVELNPKSQLHFDANAVIGKDQTGYATITPSTRNSILAQSMFYFRSPSTGSILAMYGSQAREATGQTLVGSYNLFLGMSNWLKLINPSDALARLYLTTGQSGTPMRTVTLDLSPHQTIDLALHSTATFGTTADTYGTISVTSANKNQVLAEVLRFRTAPGSATVDFAAPTAIR